MILQYIHLIYAIFSRILILIRFEPRKVTSHFLNLLFLHQDQNKILHKMTDIILTKL